ncbi:hypothetical protein CEY00_Acc29009 [Actinidia chinensis var. chinensis]|uniref:Uncharacterized protein n=1 Tax=Actinidia chinensis var. chinensis TaxID=1590841 RepID=A0A2R6PJ11_ACTCC|nr:hypothetical protein CEY00_Acc29009 [Actinidia chinensis var. chinensis]
MVVAVITEEESHVAKQPKHSWTTDKRSSLAHDLIPRDSPSSSESPRHVVVVMDGLKEFTMEPLEWVLKNIALDECCSITLLGVMPWLNIPLSSKTWSDIWTMDLEDLSNILEKSEWKSDVKYQKVRRLIDVCQKYGVKPQMRSEMGYPLQLLAVEQIISLHATLVVFDRHHQKYSEFYAERLPCNLVMMNEEGEVDMIKGRSLIDTPETTPCKSPVSSAHSPVMMIAAHIKRIFKQRAQETHA